jgi:signal transduction histidine kinase
VGLASYREKRWLNFGFANGLTNSPIKRMMEGKGGSLWLVTAKEGFYQYRPDTEAPETEFTAATETVPYGGIGVFSFRAVDAWQRTPPHVLLYSWRVLHDDGSAEQTSWNAFSPETSHIAENLKPGAYRFEVRASDDARNVDPTPASLAFTVAYPLWSEPRVYLSVGAMVMLLALAFVLRIRSHHALLRSEAALYESNQQLMSEIRERLQAEQRLNDHFEQLEELVRGRTEELEIAQRALVEQERLATLGKVTASVSHELRNPLGTLRGTLFMISRKVQGLDLGLEEALARGERSIQRCDRIIEEFLDFTRTVAMELERVPMDKWLAGVLQEMVIPLEIDCDYTFESGLELEIDPERLRRAVINVVNNAVQAMEDSSGEYKRLRVKSRARDGRFEIVVKDNGPGMSEESLSRIFEPLYSTKGFGVGLGVPIVKSIMVKHRGGVEYRSVPGKGTTVVLWLPA